MAMEEELSAIFGRKVDLVSRRAIERDGTDQVGKFQAQDGSGGGFKSTGHGKLQIPFSNLARIIR